MTLLALSTLMVVFDQGWVGITSPLAFRKNAAIIITFLLPR